MFMKLVYSAVCAELTVVGIGFQVGLMQIIQLLPECLLVSVFLTKTSTHL